MRGFFFLFEIGADELPMRHRRRVAGCVASKFLLDRGWKGVGGLGVVRGHGRQSKVVHRHRDLIPEGK